MKQFQPASVQHEDDSLLMVDIAAFGNYNYPSNVQVKIRQKHNLATNLLTIILISITSTET